MTYSFNRQYAEAIAECEAANQMDKSFMPSIRVRRWTYLAVKDYEGARYAFEEELKYGGGSVDQPGWRLIQLQLTEPGEDRTESLKLLDAAVSSDLIRGNHKAFAFEAALAYNALGETAKALDWLEKSEAARSHSFNFLEVDPRIQNLKDEPRFRKLVEKLRSPKVV
jgi:tetratricopeptide (TPR) repeat protein